jgi:hypothetical protein
MCNLTNKYGIITTEAFTNTVLQILIYILQFITCEWLQKFFKILYTGTETQTLKYFTCEQQISFLPVVIQLRTRIGKYVMQLWEHSQGHDFLLCKQIQQT